ncbi:hypothetical protein L596_001082 [Steinernema carpocapsae]|uniref:RRM domain-containing protein n=1 Tax=Steinernema carpocapsae TaxID=34508 RepID=A0A4V6I700_STECR|nr:hypothetical protein L596_001082 [Steinernema carpocapsae]
MTSTRLFIGRLPSHCREGDVEKFFKNRGRIREIILKDRFGFVEFDDRRDAADAVRDLNGKDLCGERIVLEFSRAPRDRRDSVEDRRGSRFGAPRQTWYRMIVQNLSTRCSWQDLKDMMREAGEVTFANAHNLNKNEGVVCFANRAALLRALEKFEGKEINGRRMKLVDDSRRSPSLNRNSRTSCSRKRSRSLSASLCKNRSGLRNRSPLTPRTSEKRSRTDSPSSTHPAVKKERGSPHTPRPRRYVSFVGSRVSTSPTSPPTRETSVESMLTD